MTPLVSHARDVAEALLAEELPRRWAHVRAVAAKAETISQALELADQEVLIASAWLHDVGYSKEVVVTGFHPLDGARWLRERGFDTRVTQLVAHHSCALVEADERGLRGELTLEFRREESPTADALWYCDMTTGPDGQDFEVHDRLDEIRSRYGPRHVVTRFIERARPEIIAAVRRTEERLAALPDRQPM